MPGHEDLVGHGFLAEYLLPRSRGFGARRFPILAELGNQAILIFGHVIEELFGNRAGECGLGRGNPVVRPAGAAHFVLHLHHDDRVGIAIHFADVAHERGVGVGVGLPVGLVEHRHVGDVHAVLRQEKGILLGVLFDPQRRVAGHGVLPASNHRNTRRWLCLRASRIMPSTSAKSNWSGSG